MQAVNPRFSAAVARESQSPAFYASINGVAASYATHFIRDDNVLTDGGFEVSGLPDWAKATTGGTVNEDTVDFIEGLQSLRLDRTDAGVGALAVSSANFTLPMTAFPFGAGVFRADFARVRVSFRAKTDSGVSRHPAVKIQNQTTGADSLNDNGRFEAGLGGDPFANHPDLTSSWQRYDIVFSVLRDTGVPFDVADNFRIFVRHEHTGSNSSIWVDDIRIERIDERLPNKKAQLLLPATTGIVLDIIDGVRTTQNVTIELIDAIRSDGSGNFVEDITNLIGTDASGAEVPTLINRRVTIFAGYRDLAIEDYEPVFVGRIRALKMNASLTGYQLTLSDASYLLDGEVFSNATEEEPTTIVGSVANVYASILRGIFSTSDPDFPLTSVSTAVAGTPGTPDSGSSAPTGLGISDTLLNFAQMKTERDRWHLDDLVQVEVVAPVNAREYLEDEFFRAFQSWPTISGDGLLGCRFHVPSLPTTSAPTIAQEEILAIRRWDRDLSSHLNKFKVLGDYDAFNDEFGATALYDQELAEDTTDQSDTEETIEYLLQSKWIRTALNGVEIAEELVGRMRIRYLKTPAIIELELPLTKRLLEEGDVVHVTHEEIPNLLAGVRGVSAHPMTILSIVPDFDFGRLRFLLLDTGFKRYGVIAPESQADFASATDAEKGTFFFISDTNAEMSDGSEGYRFA